MSEMIEISTIQQDHIIFRFEVSMQVWGDDPLVLKAIQLLSSLEATIVGNLEHPNTFTISISASSSLSIEQKLE